jgi:hypothetical protein
VEWVVARYSAGKQKDWPKGPAHHLSECASFLSSLYPLATYCSGGPAVLPKWARGIFQDRQFNVGRGLSLRHPNVSFLNGTLQFHAGMRQLS